MIHTKATTSRPNIDCTHHSHLNRPLLPKRKTKDYNPIRRKHRQPKRNRLPTRLDNPRDGAPAQHGRSQKPEFLAVRLARAQARKAEEVKRADGEAGCDGGD